MNISRGNIFGQKVVTVALLSAKCKWMVIKSSIDELIIYDDERLKASGKKRHDLTCFKLSEILIQIRKAHGKIRLRSQFTPLQKLSL